MIITKQDERRLLYFVNNSLKSNKGKCWGVVGIGSQCNRIPSSDTGSGKHAGKWCKQHCPYQRLAREKIRALKINSIQRNVAAPINQLKIAHEIISILEKNDQLESKLKRLIHLFYKAGGVS